MFYQACCYPLFACLICRLCEELCKQVSWNQSPDDDASDRDEGDENVDVTGADEGTGMGHEEGGVDDQYNA